MIRSSGSLAANGAAYAYNLAIVTQSSPSTGAPVGGTVVTLTGTNLSGATAVEFGSYAAEGFTVNSADSITAVAPPGSGTVDISVITGGAAARWLSADQFTYETTPDAPTIGSAMTGNASAIVDWTVPANDGSAITEFVVTPYADSTAETAVVIPVGASGSATDPTPGAVDSFEVTGLVNGTTYTFTVAAVNGAGAGPASAASNVVTPATVPGAPSSPTASAGNAGATLTWTAPSGNGGSAITGYVVTPYIGTTAQATRTFDSTATTETETGLTNGTAYTFKVAAINAVGTGASSAASNSVTPATVPGAPTIGTATAGNASASVRFTAPGSNGGSPVTSYTVTATDTSTPANGGQQDSGNTGPITLSGLTNGDSYTFTVTATSSIGTGPASATSNAVTPATVPGAPGSPKATAGPTGVPGDGEVELSWTAPAGNGSTITGYTVTPGPSCQGCSGLTPTSTSTTVTGLRPGTSYTFTVTATNGVGTGPRSSASKALEVVTVPSAPRALSVKATLAGTAVVTFSPPVTNGGENVTVYVVATSPVCPRCSGMTTSGTSTTVTGLTSGLRYSFSVRADNKAGTGPPSSSSAPVLVELQDGYWLAARDGDVFGLGSAASLGGVRASPADPVVGVTGSPDGKGYLVATADGTVSAFGDLKSYGDLQTRHVVRSDVVAIVATEDAKGYWLIGADGEVFAFGDAVFYGDLLHLAKPVHVTNVVGMVPALGDTGYFLVGSDGGVFAFGRTHFYGSLPGIGVKVDDIRAILPSATGKGYVLVGADGGAFVFGSGVRFYGSLPGRGIKVDDIVGLALTPDGAGYYMAGANGTVYGFGDGRVFPSPNGLGINLPVAAIAGV
jgi:hypothetical protein